jgi:hypothetical protein
MFARETEGIRAEVPGGCLRLESLAPARPCATASRHPAAAAQRG